MMRPRGPQLMAWVVAIGLGLSMAGFLAYGLVRLFTTFLG